MRRLAQASGGAALAPSLSGLASWNWASPDDARRAYAAQASAQVGYGPLVKSATCPEFEIPAGFHCQRVSVALAPSPTRPSLAVPNAFDGMASFALPNGNIRLIRNHEMTDSAARAVPLATPHYDAKSAGGTTSLEVKITGSGDALKVELVDEFVSLAGTHTNCAGGRTPWGSWLSCEEITVGPVRGYEKPHGYIFEVPASATGPVDPVPLKAMGRFVHEAIAVDPNTGYVYETEDIWYNATNPRQPGAGLYRFIPRRRDVLAEGGRLQILAVQGTRNYLTARGMKAGTKVRASWIDIENPDPVDAERDSSTVFREGLAKGAAIFARLEGAFAADGGIYVVSTNGGDAGAGQVFHYRPISEREGELTLVFESPSKEVMEGPDNICLAANGDLVLCEDASGDQYVRLVDKKGTVSNLIRHAEVEGVVAPGEFAGSCFSPDGRVLFVNVQGGRDRASTKPSVTYAMWGPWRNA